MLAFDLIGLFYLQTKTAGKTSHSHLKFMSKLALLFCKQNL